MAKRVESQDINDGDIVAQSVLETNDKGDMVRFLYKDENGTVLVSSEFMREDQKRRALLPWCAAVRNALVAQSEEAVAEERARIRSARAAEAPSLVSSTGEAIRAPGNAPSATTPGVSTPDLWPAAISQDPKAYVREQMNMWNLRAIEAAGALQEANEQFTEAQAKVKEWETVAKALGVRFDNESNSSTERAASDTAGSVFGSNGDSIAFHESD